jgi:hypothetical protein
LSGGGGRQSKKIKKRELMRRCYPNKQVQFFSGRWCAVGTHTSQSYSRHSNKFTNKYNRKGKHSYRTQVHRTRSYS